MNFVNIEEVNNKGNIILRPAFILTNNSELIIQGNAFFAFYDSDTGLWNKNLMDLYTKIDELMDARKSELVSLNKPVLVEYMRNCRNDSVNSFNRFVKYQGINNYKDFDSKIMFDIDTPKKNDYCTHKLCYHMTDTPCPNWEHLVTTLYDDDEANKIRYIIGSIISGDSITNQKIYVFFGDPGTGKSTILNIIEQMFDGYCSHFSAKDIGSGKNQFATSWLNKNPLIAIQHDGDLYNIIDNTILNQIVSHESVEVNEKYKSTYYIKPKCTLLMGTNRPVKITDSRAGMIRRLVDIHPSNRKLSIDDYNTTMNAIAFEYGGIAKHCLDWYNQNKHIYDGYRPLMMISATNNIFDFLQENIYVLKKQDGTATLQQLYEMYKEYCDDSNEIPLKKKEFKLDVSAYFEDFLLSSTITTDDSRHTAKNVFKGFKYDMILGKENKNENNIDSDSSSCNTDVVTPGWLILTDHDTSILDDILKDEPAQEAISVDGSERPKYKWQTVKKTLKEINNKVVHYVKVPLQHIVIDFDIKDSDGNKSMSENLKAASCFPETYAECSKSGNGIHLHYIYDGDVTKLSRIYSPDIEVKVFTGDASLRRKLTKCNDCQIATIASGLPIKEDYKVLSKFVVKNEKQLRTMILRNLNKEYHSYTTPSVSFILKLLNDAYDSGIEYDVSDLYQSVNNFAMNSNHQASTCLDMVAQMKFKSKHEDVVINDIPYKDDIIIFYDIEVFKNVFILCYKRAGEENKVIKCINPTPEVIEDLCKYKLIGFNNKNYDDHILYARILGYDTSMLYKLSQKIINTEKGVKDNGKFREAYNLSYTDVYDFCAKKQSLKKWEIELGIHHMENAYPWDEPLDESHWEEVANYCANDVLATEAVYNARIGDFVAREILADLADGSVGMSTNSLSTKFIFGNNRTPQNEFCYRDLSKPVYSLEPDVESFLKEHFPEMMSTTHGEDKSILPYFPDYKFNPYAANSKEKSIYRGENVGEGGFAQGKPGIYYDIALLDVASMHPHSCMSECFFGPRYTKKYWEIVNSRILIKHEEYDKLPDFLQKYVGLIKTGKINSGDLSQALKIVINSVYGLTSASFPNPFKLDANVDNIIAKRGALFMIDLKNAVLERGFDVAHIKTDSIKIPNATPEIIEFVMNFGKKYGYTFEHECTYDRMCLLNDSVYICKYATEERCKQLYGYAPKDNKKSGGTWHATGTQFLEPYVFKKLFSHEEIVFEDLCLPKEVKSPAKMYVDLNYNLPDVTNDEKLLVKYKTQLKNNKINETEYSKLEKELTDKIKEGHNYRFIGRIGNFVPVIDTFDGGGPLVRSKDGIKYDSVTGTKGYRFAEAQLVKNNYENMIDYSYFEKLVNDTISDISELGDYNSFIE